MRAHSANQASCHAARCAVLALVLAATFATAPHAHGFAKLGYFWLGGTVTLQTQLGESAVALTDGSRSWNSVAEAAATDWNLQLGRVRFATISAAPPTSSTDEDHVNNVFFARDVYGMAFDARTLAVTVPHTLQSAATETDVIVNQSITWDSYRGPLRTNASGSPVQDLRRVLLHEFGHVLGLDHPDQARPVQTVSAIMNSTVGNLEALQTDDTNGLRTLYFPNGAVAITANPASVTKNLNEPVTFSVVGSNLGSGTLRYTWMFTRPGGQPERLELANEATFTLGGAQPADAGIYQALVYTANGAALSAPATLTVRPSVVSASTRLANISTRGFVGTDAGVLISGFVIGGGTPKEVLIRAIGGSTLGGFGVTGTLPEPRLVLIDSAGQTVAQNENGSGPDAAAISEASSRLGAFALPPGSTDAALLVTLAPGSYTAQVFGAGSATGVALVEVYDADANAALALTRKLGNLSTRGSVGPNGNLLIAGLVVSGTEPRTFLIRAIGPTLTRFGITNALIDPVLTLHDASGVRLRYNDDWDTPYGSTPSLRAAATRVGAFGLIETRDNTTGAGLDSVMLVTLAPGNYTAQVSGFANATGIALIEIYEMPN
jgi:hypothetical protein